MAAGLKYLCDAFGIPSTQVYGMAGAANETRECHAWNLVQVDGEWYHFDPTWNGQEMEYFCLDDAHVLPDHVIDEVPKCLPCSSMRCNFFVTQGLKITDEQGLIEQQLQEIFKRTFASLGSKNEKNVLVLLESSKVKTEELNLYAPALELAYTSKLDVIVKDQVLNVSTVSFTLEKTQNKVITAFPKNGDDVKSGQKYVVKMTTSQVDAEIERLNCGYQSLDDGGQYCAVVI